MSYLHHHVSQTNQRSSCKKCLSPLPSLPTPHPPALGTGSLVDPGLSLRHFICRIELTRPCQGGSGLTVMLPNAGCPADNIQQAPHPGGFHGPGQPFLSSPTQKTRTKRRKLKFLPLKRLSPYKRTQAQSIARKDRSSKVLPQHLPHSHDFLINVGA